MPVPTSIDQLSTTAASNSPSGSDSPSVLDDHLRAQAAFIAQLRDRLYVENVAALRALTPPPSKTTVQLAGYYAPGDGGGGAVMWVPASTKTDNGGTVFTPGSSPTNGRWERGGSGEIPVEWFGAVGSLAVNDTPYFQAASDAFGGKGGTVTFSRNYLIDTTLNLGDYVTLRGPLDLPDELLPATAADYDGRTGVLFINSSATIKPSDGGSICHALLMRKGLDLPFADGTAAAAGIAAFAGTAVTVAGAGAYVHHLLCLGFGTAVYSSGFERVRCEYVQGDCTNGIDIRAATDICTAEKCHFWPWTTTHRTWTTSALAHRSGVAYRYASVGDWNRLTSCFSYGYSTGIEIDSANSCYLVACGVDGTGAFIGSIGIHVKGTSAETLLIGCNVAGQATGVKNSSSSSVGVVIVSGGRMWSNSSEHVLISSGRLLMTGAVLRDGVVGVALESGCSGAAITGNEFSGVPTTFSWDTSQRGLVVGGNNFTNGSADSKGATQEFGDYATAAQSFSAYRADGAGVRALYKSGRGTAAAPSASQVNDIAYRLDAQFWDGAAWGTAGRIRCGSIGAATAGNTPGQWVLSTTPTGSSAPVDRWALLGNGVLQPTADNAYTLGASGARVSAIWSANGTIQTSDERTKCDIRESVLGLDFINALRPVSYYAIVGGNDVIGAEDDGTPITQPRPGTRRHFGLIAQEVKAVCDAAGTDFGGWVLADKENPESQQALRYEQFISPLIKAVQELSERVKALGQ